MLFRYLHNFFLLKKNNPFCLKPEGPSKGTVVLSYLKWPFTEGDNVGKARGHTNAFEVVAIARTYQKLGYTVEIIDHSNNSYTPPANCSVAIDLHGALERWRDLLPSNCFKILHATGAYWHVANEAERARLNAIEDRKGKILLPRRQVEPSSSALIADHITVLGNEYTQGTFSFAKKPITRIPISSAYAFIYPEQRNFSLAKKNFLWVGSFGMVHKGLDLVLEAFAKMPDLSLTVCGRPEKEEDFFKLYQKELQCTSNIHFQGWIDMSSPRFQEIAATHASIIYPSCSEGGGGSVIHAMHAGLVPLCTSEASVDLNDFGLLIPNGTVEAVMNTAQKFASLSDYEVGERAAASYEYARKHHTQSIFEKNYYAFAANLLK